VEVQVEDQILIQHKEVEEVEQEVLELQQEHQEEVEVLNQN
jgi:hypothetical protein